MGHVASLNTAWFALIGLLWTGYFCLEGFDFGVGMLAQVLSRDDLDHRLCMNTIGPFWDGNEVWLIVAGGATFAAFPTWYATMFSALYLALFLILAALIIRGVAFEFRAKQADRGWRRTWDLALAIGSAIPALLWGVAFTDLVHGIAIGPGDRYTGGLAGLVHPVALLGGLVSLLLFLLHGAVFLSLKTTGALRERARRAALVLGGPALLALAALGAVLGDELVGTLGPRALPGVVPILFVAVAILAIAGATVAMVLRRDGLGFLLTMSSIVVVVGAAFSALFPRVMVSSTSASDSLTLWNAASAHETLFVMTVVAAVFTPVVLAYQGFSYWVLRKRLSRPPQQRGPSVAGAETR